MNLLGRQIRRFVNEVILEEESDEIEGGFVSHFSYYFDAFNAIDGNYNDFRHVADFYEKVTYGSDSYAQCKSMIFNLHWY